MRALLVSRAFVCCLCFFVYSSCFALSFETGASYEVCFSPNHTCSYLIVRALDGAKKSVRVQAYSFTSKRIAKALVKAKDRGIHVKVIVDKSQFEKGTFSRVPYLLKQGIPIFKDDKVSIAHNKVMIIDDETVVTGSYNFTVSADRYNAENLLVIKDKGLAKHYTANWLRRFKSSTPVT